MMVPQSYWRLVLARRSIRAVLGVGLMFVLLVGCPRRGRPLSFEDSAAGASGPRGVRSDIGNAPAPPPSDVPGARNDRFEVVSRFLAAIDSRDTDALAAQVAPISELGALLEQVPDVFGDRLVWSWLRCQFGPVAGVGPLHDWRDGPPVRVHMRLQQPKGYAGPAVSLVLEYVGVRWKVAGHVVDYSDDSLPAQSIVRKRLLPTSFWEPEIREVAEAAAVETRATESMLHTVGEALAQGQSEPILQAFAPERALLEAVPGPVGLRVAARVADRRAGLASALSELSQQLGRATFDAAQELRRYRESGSHSVVVVARLSFRTESGGVSADTAIVRLRWIVDRWYVVAVDSARSPWALPGR